MYSWQWESFEEVIKSYAPVVDDHGPLARPIYRFTIQRSDNLSLRMESEAPESALESPSLHSVGTVRINDDRVTFHNVHGLKLEAIGVRVAQTNRRFEGVAPGVTTQSVVIHRLVGKLPNDEPAHFVVDWLENVPAQYLWCDNIGTKGFDSTSVALGGLPPNRPKLEMKGSGSSEGNAWAAAGLEVDGMPLYLCQLDKVIDPCQATRLRRLRRRPQ
jgi:hypothetical protein